MKIYLASSWRNPYQETYIASLRYQNYEVYDFKNPYPGNHGFHWTELDPEYQAWTPKKFREALFHPIAQEGYSLDFAAMARADVGVLLLPCGKSAHLEAGYFVGAKKPLIIVLDGTKETVEPELMYLMGTSICSDLRTLLFDLQAIKERG